MRADLVKFWSEGSPDVPPMAWVDGPEGREVQRNLLAGAQKRFRRGLSGMYSSHRGVGSVTTQETAETGA